MYHLRRRPGRCKRSGRRAGSAGVKDGRDVAMLGLGGAISGREGLGGARGGTQASNAPGRLEEPAWLAMPFKLSHTTASVGLNLGGSPIPAFPTDLTARKAQPTEHVQLCAVRTQHVPHPPTHSSRLHTQTPPFSLPFLTGYIHLYLLCFPLPAYVSTNPLPGQGLITLASSVILIQFRAPILRKLHLDRRTRRRR
jgi:hypothetical protein